MLRISLYCIVLATVFGFIAQIIFNQYANCPSAPMQAPAKSVLLQAESPSYAMVKLKLKPDETEASFVYPELVWPGNEDRIRFANQQLRKLIATHLQDARMPETNFYELNCSVETLTPKLVSIRIKYDYMMEGMSHPFHSLDSFNFDIERNYQLKKADVWLDDSRSFADLQRFCRVRLEQREPDAGGATCAHDEATESPEKFLTFTINDEGVSFVLPYSYLSGDYREVTVPFGHRSLKASRYEHPPSKVAISSSDEAASSGEGTVGSY